MREEPWSGGVGRGCAARREERGHERGERRVSRGTEKVSGVRYAMRRWKREEKGEAEWVGRTTTRQRTQRYVERAAQCEGDKEKREESEREQRAGHE